MYRILLVICLVGLVLTACTAREKTHPGFLETFEGNPLMAEAIADQMIEFVTDLQIIANERKQPIKDPAILRAMDDTFIEARRIRDEAFMRQNEGKSGTFQGIQEASVEGEVLLTGESLYLGYDFRSDVAIDLHVILSKHVAPSTEAELKAEPTLDLGLLQNILGPQEYYVGPLSADDWNQYRTVAIYSAPLKRVMGLAQIRGVVREEEMEAVSSTSAAHSSSSQ